MSQLQVHLYRDSFSTPWGIRLQGGKDVGQALVIQRVFANSPAEGNLQRGDIVLKLNNCDAEDLTHKKAQDLFNSAGGQILLLIKRVQLSRKEVASKPKDTKPNASVSASEGQKMAPTLTSNSKVGSESSSSAKSKDISYGGGGFDVGIDYRKVKVDANYVPGPIFTEEEEAEQEEQDQAYRTVPLDLTGPLGASSPKFGGSGVDFGVVYSRPAGLPAEPVMQRQSSKPWEDQEMLYKVHDTLSHIQFPYTPPAAPMPAAPASGISCLNMYSNAPSAAPPSMAPPPYVPGPPAEQESNYIDPFPNHPPSSVAAEDDDDYEFVPVRQRRNQFNKFDAMPQERKPIKPQRPPPVFAPSPSPAPVPKPKPPTPIAAPMYYTPPAPFMPAEGEVVQPSVPAWAGTLSNSGGPKRWDGGYNEAPRSKPARSVSPTKKAAAPPSGDFKPTQTKVLDFSGDVDEGPRIMHLQYNSPLDMYSKQNVEETLQGQTTAALGGGNTVAPTKTPAEERDWSQSALLRLIQEEETYNVPKTVPHQPVQAEPRPAASPPKHVVPPPEPTPPLAEPQEVVPDIPNTFQFQNAMPMTGVSDF